MALLIPALALAACAAPRSAPADHPASAPGTGMAKVDIFGDSLAYQAAPYFNELVEASGQAKVTDFVFGGTATCDWLPDMRRVARDQPPRVVVMEFAGNTFTACMRSCVPESSSTIIRYCSAMSQAIGIFLAAGAHIYLEGTPIDYRQWIRHDPHWDDLNRAFAQLAGRYPGRVTYVDAGRAVEGSDQAFVWMLPCMAFEPCPGWRGWGTTSCGLPTGSTSALTGAATQSGKWSPAMSTAPVRSGSRPRWPGPSSGTCIFPVQSGEPERPWARAGRRSSDVAVPGSVL
jgi:hypothetical protein